MAEVRNENRLDLLVLLADGSAGGGAAATVTLAFDSNLFRALDRMGLLVIWSPSFLVILLGVLSGEGT